MSFDYARSWRHTAPLSRTTMKAQLVECFDMSKKRCCRMYCQFNILIQRKWESTYWWPQWVSFRSSSHFAKRNDMKYTNTNVWEIFLCLSADISGKEPQRFNIKRNFEQCPSVKASFSDLSVKRMTSATWARGKTVAQDLRHFLRKDSVSTRSWHVTVASVKREKGMSAVGQQCDKLRDAWRRKMGPNGNTVQHVPSVFPHIWDARLLFTNWPWRPRTSDIRSEILSQEPRFNKSRKQMTHTSSSHDILMIWCSLCHSTCE